MSHWEIPKNATDEWYTPKYIFDALDCVFDLDVASPPIATHVPALHFITELSLQREWNGFVWCNPPFGGRNGIVPWIDKMNLHNNGILLTPDRTSAPWWQNTCKNADAVLFIAGKVKFINGVNPDAKEHPSNGTCLFAYGAEAVKSLSTAQNNKLGILLIKSDFKI